MSSLGLTVPSGRGATLPRTSTTILRPQRLRRLQGFVAAFRGEDDLGLAVAVAEVDEQHAAMVAVGIDPAAEGHLLADVVQTQFAAGMSPQQVLTSRQKVCRMRLLSSIPGTVPIFAAGTIGHRPGTRVRVALVGMVGRKNGTVPFGCAAGDVMTPHFSRP